MIGPGRLGTAGAECGAQRGTRRRPIGANAHGREHFVINRREFLQIASVGGWAVVHDVRGQAPGSVKRIGVLIEAKQPDRPVPPPQWLLDALRKRGWIEGRNLAFEVRFADQRDRLPGLAQELVQAKVDVIVTFGTPATRAAKAATTTIPVAFNVGDDPVATGLVSSMSHPGGNLTGIVYGLLDEKLLDVFKQAMPKASRVVLPVASPSDAARRAALALGVEIVASAVAGPAALDAFFQSLQKMRPDGVVVPNVAWMGEHSHRFAEGLREARMPAIAPWSEFVHAGGLLSYGAEGMPERRAARIDALLRGANPRDIPVEMPTHYRLGVNLITAKALGVTIPSSLLLQAHPDDVIRS